MYLFVKKSCLKENHEKRLGYHIFGDIIHSTVNIAKLKIVN